MGNVRVNVMLRHFRITIVAMKKQLVLQILSLSLASFGGLEVVCWPLVPKFAGSNPAEVVGFLRPKKSSARLPLEGK